MSSSRKYSLIVWGATGFTGRLICEHLLQYCPKDLTWAIGGRDKGRLEKLHSSIGASKDVGIVVADPADLEAMKAVTSQTVALIAAAGPFFDYGRMVVKACALTGTSYCDITGEPHFAAWSIEENEENAKKTGAAIVHFCGMDSVPFDYFTYLCVEELKKRGYDKVWEAREYIVGMGGAASGGTIATMASLFGNPALASSVAADPYSLNPKNVKGSGLDVTWYLPEYEPRLKKWTSYGLMSAVDCKVSRRSAALRNYGPNYHCDERQAHGSIFVAIGLTLGLFIFVLFMALPPTRWLLLKYVFPAPGQGPTKEQQKNGYMKTRHFVEADVPQNKFVNGRRPYVSASALLPSDPGYSATAIIISEIAILLAQKKYYLLILSFSHFRF